MSKEWISAREAADFVWPGRKPAPTPNVITRRAAQGMIKANTALLTKQGPEGITKVPHCSVPDEFWGGRAMIPDWQSGDFSAQVQQNGKEEKWSAFGVTFKQTDIEAIAQPKSCANVSWQSAVAGARATLGRPHKFDWEKVMIEMARQLYVGDLQPKVQADIEKAIAAYLTGKISMSESTIREHARPLWRAIQSEAGK